MAGELHRVGQKIDGDLFDGPLVGIDRQRVCNLGVDSNRLILGLQRNDPHRLRDQRCEIDVFAFHIHMAGFDFRHVENVVDDAQKIVAARIDVARIFDIAL